MTAPERFADSQIPLAPRAPSIHDPLETCAAQDFRSAKALFVPSLKRDIVPPLHGHDPHGRVAWQLTFDGENSYSHWAAARPPPGRSRRKRSRPTRLRASDTSGPEPRTTIHTGSCSYAGCATSAMSKGAILSLSFAIMVTTSDR